MKFYQLFISFLLIIFLWSDFAIAQETRQQAQVHEVQARETLFSIARRYNITVQDIRDWNNLESDVLSPGMEIFVSEPPRQQTPPPAPPETTSEIETPPTTVPEVETPAPVAYRFHTVQPGETLFSISRQYEIDVNEIRRLNNLDSNVLSIGQELIVGETRQAVRDTAVTDRPTEQREPEQPVAIVQPPVVDTEELDIPDDDSESLRLVRDTPSLQIHTVRRGETLSSISRMHDITLGELRQLNPELRGDVISPGQRLVVRRHAPEPNITGLEVESTAQGRFFTHEFQRGESINRLLERMRMDREDFMALNSGLHPDDVIPGMTLVLLAPPTVQHDNPYRVRRADLPAAEGSESMQMTATVYSDAERGQTTTNGELYNPEFLTAAHPNLPLGTVVHAVNPENGRGVFVLINDRTSGSSLKLSSIAFRTLRLNESENPEVEVTIVGR